MATILLPTIEGPHVADSKPLAVLGKAMAPRGVLRARDSMPLVSLVVSVAPVAPLTVVIMETLRLKLFAGVGGGLVPQIEGVHVADARPLVALVGAVVIPSRGVTAKERIRVGDGKPLRVRRRPG